MNVEKALKEAIEILQKNSVASAILDAKILIQHVSSLSREDIVFKASHLNLSEHQQKKFFDLIQQRAKKIPLTHLTNNREFFANNFYVDENVLDPRPDSEALIEMIIEKFDKVSSLNICEIGSGSGCLIISLLKHFENWFGLALDISAKALLIAKKNAEINQVLSRINFIQSDLFSNLPNEKIFDIIISNPPYIPTNEIENLQD